MSYPGSKAQSGTWQRIIGQMPPHSVYVEAFFGSGQVFHQKRPAESSVLIDRNIKCFERLPASRNVRPLLGDALELLPSIPVPSDAVLYCDPPYVHATRQGRLYYEHEMDDAQHASLLALLQGMKCRVMVSGYPCDLYSSQLRDWRCLAYWTMTRGGRRRECLWCNFPEPDELHDWRYAGQNFRQRTALKRLAARWLAKLDRMTPRKRGYVLDAIAQRRDWR
jgi:DNA adenine methylase